MHSQQTAKPWGCLCRRYVLHHESHEGMPSKKKKKDKLFSSPTLWLMSWHLLQIRAPWICCFLLSTVEPMPAILLFSFLNRELSSLCFPCLRHIVVGTQLPPWVAFRTSQKPSRLTRFLHARVSSKSCEALSEAQSQMAKKNLRTDQLPRRNRKQPSYLEEV